MPTSHNEPQIPYDIIELPSQGIFYSNNKKTVKVSYLTAADENILTSPGLINSGEVMDILLKTKILDKDINPIEPHENKTHSNQKTRNVDNGNRR